VTVIIPPYTLSIFCQHSLPVLLLCCRQSALSATLISRDALSPFAVQWFQWNLAQIFMWVDITGKIFKV